MLLKKNVFDHTISGVTENVLYDDLNVFVNKMSLFFCVAKKRINNAPVHFFYIRVVSFGFINH